MFSVSNTILYSQGISVVQFILHPDNFQNIIALILLELKS